MKPGFYLCEQLVNIPVSECCAACLVVSAASVGRKELFDVQDAFDAAGYDVYLLASVVDDSDRYVGVAVFF